MSPLVRGCRFAGSVPARNALNGGRYGAPQGTPGTVAVPAPAAMHGYGAIFWPRVDARARVAGLAFPVDPRYQGVMDRQSIDNLARQLADAVPEGLRSMRADLEQNFRSVLRSALERLELVSREEVEVQQAVLARTRQKLESMEARLAELEAARPKKAPRKKTAAKRKPAGGGEAPDG